MERSAVLEQIQPIMRMGLRKVDHGAGARVVIGQEQVALKPSKGSRAITFTEDGQRNLLSFANIPMAMDNKLSMDTRARVANELLARKGPYSVIVNDNQITGFATDKQEHNALNPERVLKTVEKALSIVNYNRVHVEGAAARIELTTDQQATVARGDLVQAGAVIQFSPIGTEFPSVESYVLRLSCTNGMTSNDVFQKFGHGEGDDVWHFFRQAVRAAVRALARIAGRYIQMMRDNIPPDQRALVLEAMIKEARISPEIADAIRARAIAEPPRTAYDVMNMITYASSHDLTEPKEVIRAQRAAAKFIDESEHTRLCPTCRSKR